MIFDAKLRFALLAKLRSAIFRKIQVNKYLVILPATDTLIGEMNSLCLNILSYKPFSYDSFPDILLDIGTATFQRG